MSIINLKDLISKASVLTTDALVKRSVVWEQKDSEGNEVTDTFDVFIVRDVSFAASDRIYLGDPNAPDSSRHARMISERIRLGDNGDEKLSFEDASNLKSSLGWALARAVSDFDKENAPKDLKDVKTSSQNTKSGMSLSSTESAEGQ